MNSTRKMLLSLCSVLLLTFGAFACKSTSDQSSVNNGTQAGSTVSQNTAGDVNTAGLGNSTGAYVGGSGGTASEPTSSITDANNRVGGRENQRMAPADTSYSGTGQTLVTSNGTNTVATTSTTTYSTPTVVTTAPVAPNTTATVDTTATMSTPVTTAEVTTPTTTDTYTSTTTTDTTPMTSSVQESTTTTTPATTTTHRRMHKD
jgi:hypothetical protein